MFDRDFQVTGSIHRRGCIALAIAVVCTGVCGTSATAEYVNEFPFPEVTKQAHEASAVLLEGISMTFRAIAQAERGNQDGARGNQKEALSLFTRSQELFSQVRREMRVRPISLVKAPKMFAGRPIEAIFASYKLAVPKSTAELAAIADGQLTAYKKAVELINFGERSASRAQIDEMTRQLRSLMELGLIISALADAAT